ncbi:MAG: DUF2937 family protein [Pseudomonadota bacterium]
MGFLGSILDRLLLIGAVLVAGAFPSFATQYEQQLTASLNQASDDLAPFQAIADRHHGGSLDRLVAHHRNSDDPVFYEEGDAIESLMGTLAALRTSQSQMQGGLFSDARHIVTTRHPDIRASTLSSFRPSMEYRPDALVFALAAGFTLWFLIAAPCRMLAGGARRISTPRRRAR